MPENKQRTSQNAARDNADHSQSPDQQTVEAPKRRRRRADEILAENTTPESPTQKPAAPKPGSPRVKESASPKAAAEESPETTAPKEKTAAKEKTVSKRTTARRATPKPAKTTETTVAKTDEPQTNTQTSKRAPKPKPDTKVEAKIEAKVEPAPTSKPPRLFGRPARQETKPDTNAQPKTEDKTEPTTEHKAEPKLETPQTETPSAVFRTRKSDSEKSQARERQRPTDRPKTQERDITRPAQAGSKTESAAEDLGLTLRWRSNTDAPANDAPPEPASQEKQDRQAFRDRRKTGRPAKPSPFRAPRAETQENPLAPDPNFAVDDELGLLTVLEFRPPQEIPEQPEDEFEGVRGRRAPRRSRGRDQARDITAADAFRTREEKEEASAATVRFRKKDAEPEPAPEPPKTPQPVRREPVPRKEEAAQVAIVDGHPVLLHKKKVLAPFALYANASNGNSSAVLEEVKLAGDRGLHLFSFTVNLDVDPEEASTAVHLANQTLAAAAKANPDLKAILRVAFRPPQNWEKDFPEAVFKDLQGQVAEPSAADDAYWAQAEEAIAAFVKEILTGPNAAHVLGLHLDQEEWFLAVDEGYDRSKAATAKFREWLRLRYRNDAVSLRASWFDGKATFENVEVPERDKAIKKDGVVRTDRKARRWIDYHLFASDVTVDRIAQLCYAAKKASDGELLMGVSYGYTFEWSHPYSGHLSLGKLLRCPELDYVAGPPSYKDREPGGSAAFPFPVDSFALNGKLYISEEDFRTPISGRPEPDDRNPVMKTPQALESAHWRGAGGALAHNGGVLWMDTNGHGWLNSPGIWDRAKEIHDALLRRLATKRLDPDVALFIDERSLAYLTDPRAFQALVQQTREAMLRSGLSVGFYLLSDLAHRENFPECKLHVFVNAWDIRPEVRSAIKARLQRDNKTLLWLYTAGLFEAGRDSLERVREVTGIALRPQPFHCKSGTTVLNTRDELCQQLPSGELLKGGDLEPSYFAIPEEAKILGEYTQTGLPSFVTRTFAGELPEENWTSVFLGEPVVTPGFFRVLAQQAGAHVYTFDNDLVHVTPPFLTVHCSKTGPRTIMLPSKWVAYSLDLADYMPVDHNAIRFKAVDGSTHTFIVGPQGEVESIVAAKLDDLTQVTQPVVRPENTLQWDAIKFDVPIMKLDEWVEETWSEELADDLLLKPSLVDNDTPPETDPEATPDKDSGSTATSTGRRRRRRRAPAERRDRRDNDPPANRNRRNDRGDDDSGISFLFRKRE